MCKQALICPIKSTMPFKLKLKRTKRYEVSSKNAYVVGIHMLDSSFLECTLSSDSKGGECLDSISQRIELSEVGVRNYMKTKTIPEYMSFKAMFIKDDESDTPEDAGKSLKCQ